MASGHHAVADATAAPSLTDRVAQAVAPYLSQAQFPGVSVAVVDGGRVALVRGYGVGNARTGAPVGSDTRFQIASVTKTFTAVGVLMLYQEGRGTSNPLDLDAPIGRYLHDTRSFKLSPRWSHVTTRELLAMTSGIRDVEDARPWSVQLRSIAGAPLLYAPGTHNSYSDMNYDLLGQLIEQRSGVRYDRFIQDRILGPLGMSGTQVLGGTSLVPNQAIGYGRQRHGRWMQVRRDNGKAMYAASGMVSTARDMASYMTALLAGRLLDPATYRLMWSPVSAPPYGSIGSSTSRGLGWDSVIATSAGPIEASKGGRVPGYSSQLILYPATGDGVFVALNTNGPNRSAPGAGLADRVASSVYQAIGAGSSG